MRKVAGLVFAHPTMPPNSATTASTHRTHDAPLESFFRSVTHYGTCARGRQRRGCTAKREKAASIASFQKESLAISDLAGRYRRVEDKMPSASLVATGPALCIYLFALNTALGACANGTNVLSYWHCVVWLAQGMPPWGTRVFEALQSDHPLFEPLTVGTQCHLAPQVCDLEVAHLTEVVGDDHWELWVFRA